MDEPNNENTITSPEVARSIDVSEISKFTALDIYRRCIDAQAFEPTSDSMVPFVAKGDVLRPIVDEHVEKIRKTSKDWEDQHKSVSVPEGFNFDLEAKNGTQKAVSIIAGSNLIDIQTIRGASRYVGPGNTIYVEENADYYFAPTDQYHDWLHESDREKDYSYGKTLPPAPAEKRNTFFNLKIGGVGIRGGAAERLRIAQEMGIPLTVDQAFRFEIATGCGHEYGHAIKRSLDNQGINTQQRAIELGFIRSSDLLGYGIDEIHDELFARTIETAVEKRYLMQELGFSEAEATEFMSKQSKHGDEVANASYSFLEYAFSKGYTPDQIIKLQNAVALKIDDLYSGEEEISVWNTIAAIAYRARPYTEVQLTKLVKK